MKANTLSALASTCLFAHLVSADLPSATVTTAPAAIQTALVSFISDYDHHTVGLNATVGSIISSVYVASAANPTAANAILIVRTQLNMNDGGPTPLWKALESPSSVLASIAAQIPTTAPFPAAFEVVSSIYGYLGSLASAELNGETSIPPAPSGWTLPALTGSIGADIPTASSSSASVSATSTSTMAAAAASQTAMVNGAVGASAPQNLAILVGALIISLWCLA